MAGMTWSFSGKEGWGWPLGCGGELWAIWTTLPISQPLTPSYSDITEEDLEEAGVQDPAHKRLLLDTLQLSK